MKRNIADKQLRIPKVTTSQLVKLLGIDGSTIRRMEREGRFPKAVNITGSHRPVLRWHEEDVEHWVNERSVRSGYQGPYIPEYLEK